MGWLRRAHPSELLTRGVVLSAGADTGAMADWASTAAPRVLRALRVIHPLPCTINALVVVSLAVVAEASQATAATLGISMFACQASIGAVNDVCDSPADRIAKPTKPIPAGDIDAKAATAIGIGAGSIGLLLSATFGAQVLVLGAAGLACGLAYDLRLKQAGLGWLCFALAFPVLLAWTWLAAADVLPPGWPLLLPLAALAGPTIHLANSLVDVESDVRVGTPSLATRLGRSRGLVALTGLSAILWSCAWAVLLSLPAAPRECLLAALGATGLGWLGVTASWAEDPNTRERGWLLQASALGLLAVAWVVAAG